jgi:hypothetical protein
VGVSRLLSELRKLERELNETHNLKRTYPEFPIEVKIPKYRGFRDSLCFLYQKKCGFRVWSPNHFTRASLVSPFVPVQNPVVGNLDPSIRATGGSTSVNYSYWNVRVGNGSGATQKQDITLKSSSPIQANSGTSARVDGATAYQRQFSAVFNAGVIPSGYVIREVGLFCHALVTETISGQSFTAGTEYLVSRFSVDDGDFSPYTPNTSLPLTVNLIYQWTLT